MTSFRSNLVTIYSMTACGGSKIDSLYIRLIIPSWYYVLFIVLFVLIGPTWKPTTLCMWHSYISNYLSIYICMQWPCIQMQPVCALITLYTSYIIYCIGQYKLTRNYRLWLKWFELTPCPVSKWTDGTEKMAKNSANLRLNCRVLILRYSYNNTLNSGRAI